MDIGSRTSVSTYIYILYIYVFLSNGLSRYQGLYIISQDSCTVGIYSDTVANTSIIRVIRVTRVTRAIMRDIYLQAPAGVEVSAWPLCFS